MSALRDPVTGLRNGEQLHVDLSLLDSDQLTSPHVLATITLAGLRDYEDARGNEASERLRSVLAARLVAALGESGKAYLLEPGRFAVLARPGRASGEAIVTAATAALHDERAGITAKALSVAIPLDARAPASALRLIERELATSELTTAATPPTAHAAARPDRADVGRTYAPSQREVRHRAEGGHADEAEDAMASTGSQSIAAARRRGVSPHNRPPHGLPYLRATTRFWISVLLGTIWMALSTWVAWPWVEDLGASISMPAAILLVAGIALIPGYLNVQLVSSLLMDHPAPIDFDFSYPGLTLLIAAYEEERNISRTLAYALDQDYPGILRVIVADDGSSDATPSIARAMVTMDDRVEVIEVSHGGKANALNAALLIARTPLVATIDADTLLMPNALRRIVARMLLSPQDTVAVAGSVLARNSRAGLLTRAQTWDYMLGIGSIKRQQALLQSTLVAQGAFSVYDRDALSAAGGWPDCIGEDIVMTWALLYAGGRTSYEPTAVAFTEVPETLRHLARQRRRWARGMIEGLRTYGVSLVRRRLPYAHSVAADMLFPYLDLTFTLAFIPGLALACFGNFAIVGPMTLAVLPLNAVLSNVMYRRQRRSLRQAGLTVRSHPFGFVLYLLLYQLMMSPVSVAGYAEELLSTARRW